MLKSFITAFLFLFTFSVEAQFQIQSIHPNENCAITSQGYYGTAVKFSTFLTFQFRSEICHLFKPFYRLFSKLNNTHFNVKDQCDSIPCERCQRNVNLPFSCNRFPHSSLSTKSSSGNLPEIKKNGYSIKFFQDQECTIEDSFGFVTDRVCFQNAASSVLPLIKTKKNYRSVLYHFNSVKKVAENIGFLGNHCTGEIVLKLEYIPGKCYANGPINFMKIEKN
jgi:hypothetical protein